MTLTALIIDDEKLAREELQFLLDSVGGVDVVAQGTNGIEGVDLIEEHRPDLVFLDVQMPGLDGFAVIQKVIERNRQRGGSVEPLLKVLAQAGVTELLSREPSLEELFLALYGANDAGAAQGDVGSGPTRAG